MDRKTLIGGLNKASHAFDIEKSLAITKGAVGLDASDLSKDGIQAVLSGAYAPQALS